MTEQVSVEMIQAGLRKRNGIKKSLNILICHYFPGDYSDHIQGPV